MCLHFIHTKEMVNFAGFFMKNEFFGKMGLSNLVGYINKMFMNTSSLSYQVV